MFYQRQLLHTASLDLTLVDLFCEYILLAQDSFYMDQGWNLYDMLHCFED